MSDNQIKGIILLQDESQLCTVSKWISWFAIMILFILFMLWYADRLNNSCRLEKKDITSNKKRKIQL